MRDALSVPGSMREIERIAGDLIREARVLGTRQFGAYSSRSVDKKASDFLAVRRLIDPRLKPFLNRTEELARSIRYYQEKKRAKADRTADAHRAALAAYLLWRTEDQKVRVELLGEGGERRRQNGP